MKQQNARNISPVRMRPDDKKYVARLAQLTKTTQTEVLHHAVELLKRERQYHDMRETYAGLDAKALADMHEESIRFDKVSGDGIK